MKMGTPHPHFHRYNGDPLVRKGTPPRSPGRLTERAPALLSGTRFSNQTTATMSNKEQQQSLHHNNEKQQNKETDDNHDKKQHVTKSKKEDFHTVPRFKRNLCVKLICLGSQRQSSLLFKKVHDYKLCEGYLYYTGKGISVGIGYLRNSKRLQ